MTVAGVATAIVKRPYRKGATQVNRFTRSLMHDGKPIFHAGPFVGDLHFTHAYTREHLKGMSDFFAAHGFKYQHVLIPQNTDRNFPQSFDNGEAEEEESESVNVDEEEDDDDYEELIPDVDYDPNILDIGEDDD